MWTGFVHSKAFRRLMHKTQVFLAPEGDHYRTRMTHTLEAGLGPRPGDCVSTQDLTEAAGSGGPSGHRHAWGGCPQRDHARGFEHNVQSLRVVERLEQGRGTQPHWGGATPSVAIPAGRQAATLEGRLIRLADRIAWISTTRSTTPSGGARHCWMPLEWSQVLGFSHGERIDTRASDVIEQSRDRGAPPVRVLLLGYGIAEGLSLCASLPQPSGQGEERKAQEMLRFLFEYDRRSADRREFGGRALGGTERAVCDYIAGMTDKYAVEDLPGKGLGSKIGKGERHGHT